MKMLLLPLVLVAALATTAALAITTSADIIITVTPASTGQVAGIALSNAATTTGLSTATPVGTVSVTMTPTPPIFPYGGSNLHLSAVGTDSGGVCNGTNGAGNGFFQITGGDTLATSSTPLTAGTKLICVAASGPGITATGHAFSVAVGHLIVADNTYCAGHGGGDGSSGTPWHAACIQAALNAAVAGDTVFLAAGNWSLSSTTVVTARGDITFTGAGSGNTFDALGHPNNGSGNPVGTYTRVATDTKYGAAAGLQFLDCTGTSLVVSHIFFDGSLFTAGGNDAATLAIRNCPGAIVTDVRSWSYNDAGASSETQFYIHFSNNTTVQNSIFAEPIAASGGLYAGSEIFQVQEQNTMLVKNNIFYQETANPIDIDDFTFTGNSTVIKTDGITSPNVQAGFGAPGCTSAGCPNGGFTGSYRFWTLNNLFDSGTSHAIAIGGGINDPPNGGGIQNDLRYIGNTILGSTIAIDSCEWHIYGACAANTPTGTQGSQLNGVTVTNNSLIGATSASLTATGSGCSSSGAGAVCPASSLTNLQTVNFVAHQNYLSSPSNQYLHDIYTITPSVSGNVGLDVGSITAGPTGAFTLGTLTGPSVPFTAATFTAQYGSVRWLSSTTATTPTSGGQAGTGATWSYLPPASLAATHGNTVYMWVMDSANNISSVASALVP